MYAWKRLDLRKMDSRPKSGQLVALRMAHNPAIPFGDERFDIGYFKEDERSKSKKLWWYGNHGNSDPSGMKKHYDIWWCPVAPFDGF